MAHEFWMFVPLWIESDDKCFAAIDADNCDKEWDEVRKLCPDVKEIVSLGKCGMASGLWLVPSAKARGMEDLKAGDEVVVRTTWMSTRDNVECKVERFTKTGKIRLSDGRMFNKVGAKVEPGWGMFVLFKKGSEPR